MFVSKSDETKSTYKFYIRNYHIKHKLKYKKNLILFSISIFDVARKKQVSFNIRYEDQSSDNILERLLALKASPNTTGESLFKLYEQTTDRAGLNWKNELVGQSYDGTSIMSG